MPPLHKLLEAHPIPAGQTYAYGTAGFRYPHHVLPPVLLRVGLFAALRSASLGGQGVGIMITASHNPVEDNGVKLADPDGGMLAADWEGLAVQLANARSPREVMNAIRSMGRSFAWTDPLRPVLAGGTSDRRMVVHIGRDTRPHSLPLATLAIQAAQCLGAKVIDHGVITTPQLHHIVMHSNPHCLPNCVPVRPNEDGYMEIMSRSYAALIDTRTAENGSGAAHKKARTLTVDGACGVGYPKIRHLAAIFDAMELNSTDSDGMALQPVNGPGNGPLNDGCGAEHVQKNRLPPLIYPANGNSGSTSAAAGRHVALDYAASLDGDADRVVFHYTRTRKLGGGAASVKDSFRLLDGDAIAVLVTQFIQEELTELQRVGLGKEIRCGIVQTAYANGAATAYVQNTVGADIVVAKTGVKFVHAAAHSSFDVGVYFEANGHGTVLFSPAFYRLMDVAEAELRGEYCNRANIALQRLRVLPSLVNQAVGDAISDLLLVDAILFLKDWTIEDWDSLYEDMPSRQCKVKVQDRSVIRTNENETRAVAPSNLQPALDEAMRAIDCRTGSSTAPSRCFVRPSGTENAVRVYSEASTQADADALASEAAALLHTLCGGTGNPPTFVKSRM